MLATVCNAIARCREAAWFEVVFLRTEELKKINGQLSRLFCHIVLSFFSQDGHNFASAGIHLTLHDGTSLRIFMNYGMSLADEAALHSAYQCKGASGLKPCAICANIFNWSNVRDVVANDASGISRYHTCCEIRDIVLHTPATLHTTVQRLAAAAAAGMSAAKLAELETRLGWNLVARGIMQDDYLRPLVEPTQHMLYDTMHVYFVNGIFNVHVGRLMESLKPYSITYQTLERYVCRWNWPARIKGNAGSDALAGKRAKSSSSDGVFKCTAAEALSLVPVMAQFVKAAVLTSNSDEAKRHGACFMLLSKVLDLVEASARGNTTPQELQRAIVAHLRTFKALYGDAYMPIKFHLSIHFPMFLERWGLLPNCFVLERKHRTPKRFANEHRNTSSHWEASILRECTTLHFAELDRRRCKRRHFEAAACLVSPTTPSRRMMTLLSSELRAGPDDRILASRKARVNEWETCSQNDVVRVSGSPDFVGKIKFFASLSVNGQDHVFAGILRWAPLAEGHRCTKWRAVDDNLTLVMADEILCSLIWSESGGISTVLAPSFL